MMPQLLPWVAFPVALALLSFGCGQLLERTAGMRLPGALVPAVGLALIVVVAQVATLSDPTANLAVPVVVLLAVVGMMISSRWRSGRLDAWVLAAALGVFAVYLAPIALSGGPTTAGYVKNPDTTTWLALTDRVMEHGRSLGGLAPSSYQAVLHFYLGGGYPVGYLVPMGVARPLVGQDLAWLYQPYVAFLAAMGVLALYTLMERVVPSTKLRALAAFVAGQSALLVGYAFFAGVKEVASFWILATAAALLPSTLGQGNSARALMPLAVVSAAALGIMSLGGAVWVAPLLAGGAVAAVRRWGRELAFRQAVIFLGIAAALSLPSLITASFLGSEVLRLQPNSHLVNLVEPLSPLQLFGIWPTGDFRTTPGDLAVTDLLIAIAILAGIAGLGFAWVRRAWEIPLYLGAAAVSASVVAAFGTPWLDAKALAIGSPAILLTAMLGAASLLKRGPRLAGVIAMVAITGGVLWSNALAYHDADLAPRDRLLELQKIGKRIAGQGPTFTNEYEYFGVRHFLRDADPEAASLRRSRNLPLLGGKVPVEAQFADIDRFAYDQLIGTYRTLVLRRSPVASRPPPVYRLIWKGRYYDVWQRPRSLVNPVLAQLTLDGPDQAVAKPSCHQILRLGRIAGGGGRLAGPVRAAAILLDLSRAAHPSSWKTDPKVPEVVLPPDSGRVEGTVIVPATGRYGAWIGRSFRSRLEVFIDGRLIGSARHELNYSPGQYVPFGETWLDAGTHRVVLRYSGPDVHPGSAGHGIYQPFGQPIRPAFEMGPLVLSRSTAEQPITYVPARRARTLCGKSLDWVEALRS